MKPAFSLLVVGGSADVPSRIADRLAARGHEVRTAATVAEAIRRHHDEGADVVIAVLPLAGTSLAEFLAELRASDPRVVVIVAGSDADVREESDATDLGARDYVADPTRDLDQLLLAVGVALGARTGEAQLRYLRRKDAAGAAWQTLVGDCAAMRRVFAIVRQICHRTSSGGTPIILVTGETGTGKGILAKSIHYNSVRRGSAFVDINCAALPGMLIEAELFGHERGAFTDARGARPGLFETADGGTLFLDEIGAMPLDLQAKLLTAIEEKNVRRLGARKATYVDVQVIAATHRDLPGMVRRGELREDLYHRLNVLALELPPLRERGDDKLLLANAFLASAVKEYGLPAKHLADDACRAIERYSWPGNVRELRNQIERIVLLEDDEVVRARHFQLGERCAQVEAFAGADGLSVRLPADRCPLEPLEKEILRQALERAEGNVSQAARYLDISRQTLIYRLKKHGLAGE